MPRYLKAIIPMAAMLLIMACAGPESHTQADLVGEYAKCLADPAMPLHVVAGSPTVAEVKATLIWELASGEQTLEDIEAAMVLWCKDAPPVSVK